jgi:transmembrane sensor
LPDSTLVVLNAASSIKIWSDFMEDRKVELQGEAYFEVEKKYGSIFTVHSGALKTRVLGTKFNIQSYAEDSLVSIALVEGVVKVENNIDSIFNEVSLKPEEKLHFQSKTGAHKKSKFIVHDEIAWKDGVLVFNHSGLQEVITKIERWYDVKVKLVGKPEVKWQLTGRFDNLNIKGLAESISFTKGINCRINDQELIFEFN